jgi:uncharacterized membrane protein YfcA
MTSELALFVAATFAGAFVAGVAGFAFGLVAAAVWLHVLSPLQTATLIIAYGLIIQGWAVWKLRHAIDVRRLLPLLIGSQIGIPIGLVLLRLAPVATMRAMVGVFLIAFSLYNLVKPKVRSFADAGPLLDVSVGVASGIVGGATGLAGILPTIWTSLRGWTRDQQRAVFQPVAVAAFLAAALWLGGSGSIEAETVRLFAIGLPALLIGNWLGLRAYGKLDEAGFRRVVLIVLLAAGGALVVPQFLPG